MKSWLPFLVIGLTTGAVYAIASMGLVLTYRTSGVFNFAHGAIGMTATFAFYSLRQHVPTALAASLAILVVGPLIGVVIDRLFVRRQDGTGATTSLIVSLGLLVGLQGVVVIIYGGETRQVEAIFPTWTYRLAGINVGIDQTLVVAIAITAGLALVVFLRSTHLGLQMRAVVDNRALCGLVATKASMVTRLAWMLGCAFAATSGILFVPFVGLDSILLTLLVVEAFGAAAIGGLVSIPRTLIGALALGVLQSFATKIVGSIGNQSLVGLPSVVPFLALFLVLVFARRGFLLEAAAGTGRTAGFVSRRRFRFPVAPVGAVAVAAAVLPLVISGSRLLTLTSTVAFVLVFASLSLVVGLSRQLTLTHAVFVALGATTLSHLRSAGVPYLVALPLSALILTPFGAALALPAIRLSGLALALATFGFGVLAQNLLFPTFLVFGGNPALSLARPGFLADDKVFFYFVFAVVVGGVIAVEALRVTRLGRILVGLADSPAGIGSIGISSLSARVVTFCTSAFLGALAGGLLGTLYQSVNATTFTFYQSLIWVTVLVAAGSQSFGGVILASVLFVTVPSLVNSATVTEWQPVAFGAAAIFMAQAPNGLIGLFSRLDIAALAERTRWRLESRRRDDRLVQTAGIEVSGAGQ